MPLSPSILFTFLWSQFFVTPAYPRSDCTGKTIIVTGANVGLGKEAARHFVRLGVEKLILACRTVEMGEKAKKEIEESSGRRGVVEVWRLDLLDYESVQSFAQRAEGLKRLDAVVENAGESYFLLSAPACSLNVLLVRAWMDGSRCTFSSCGEHRRTDALTGSIQA